MNSYQKEQADALFLVQQYFENLSPSKRRELESLVADYLLFRKDIDIFLSEYFGSICTQRCYQSNISACCTREGIITFFADVVINFLVSQKDEIEVLFKVLQRPSNDFKCIYLGEQGCFWRVKPIVCEMFLCEPANKKVFLEKPHAKDKWDELNKRKKLFTWPDRPVLFDVLEKYFIVEGFNSSLMYMHNSPGLLRVKKNRDQGSEIRGEVPDPLSLEAHK
ncbi:MAG: hypothetical protein MUO43_18335, partial [Desulfobacterales bacterium]|nr:hypothetical protein [Desulfobacterales bacterium]